MQQMGIGLISDTHGIFRSQARELLLDCDHIIHAGDVNDPETLVEIRRIAPTTVVRGNMDMGSWASELKDVERVEIGGFSIVVVHNLQHLDLTELEADVVVHGHTHQYKEERRGKMLVINPGSAGPRRFTLPITMAIMTLGEGITVQKFVLKNKP